MKDRDRILYSRPFLRLAGKTQVYGTGYDDHARNRLTHSLEVAQIAKTIAAALNMYFMEKFTINIDLIEAISLGHDLGHTPFGHAGERKIDDILNFRDEKINRKLGFDKYFNNQCTNYDKIEFLNKNKGFKHNWQSIRIAIDLSRDYDNFNMDLTSLTIAGMLFHSSLILKQTKKVPSFYVKYLSEIKQCGTEYYIWSLEALIVSIADEIAQRHHDIEDAISCHYLSPKRVIYILKKEFDDLEHKSPEFMHETYSSDFTSIWDLIKDSNQIENSKIEDNITDTDIFLRKMSRDIVNWLVTDCINASQKSIQEKLNNEFDYKTVNILKENYKYEETIVNELITFSPLVKFADKLLQYRLKTIVLNSRNVQRMDRRGGFIIRKLFEAYINGPQQMPDKTIFSVFREYMRNFYIEKLKEYQEENRYLFSDASEARVALDYCTNSNNETREIIFSLERRVPYNEDKFKLSLLRVIADYISGMTDAYAEHEYRKLYGMDHDVEAF